MQTSNINTNDEDLADVLTAISVVTKRLAQKLSTMSREAKEETEGEDLNEQDE